MTIRRRSQHNNRERGQVLIVCAIVMVALLLFVGMAVDFGMAYVTHADLGKAVDSAALTGIRNLSQGQATASKLALSAFTMNYPAGGRNVVAPTVNVTWGTDAWGNPQINVNATATIQTSFIGVLPNYRTLSVSDVGQATKARVVMGLVLDRSGSMSQNGGGAALPSAVTNFINNFDNNLDSVGMWSFASDVTNNVVMPVSPATGGFITPVTNAVKAMQFVGGTYMVGGLDLALPAVNNYAVPPTENVVKVVVLFTDGIPDELNSTITCKSGSLPGGGGNWNVGGYDPGGNWVGFFTPGTNGKDAVGDPQYGPQQDGNLNVCNGTFISQQTGQPTPILYNNVDNESYYRAAQDALTMQNDGIYVYTIGLGTVVNQSWLQQVANAPGSPTFNPNLPVGDFVYAPTAADLDLAFERIAQDILYRLTQ